MRGVSRKAYQKREWDEEIMKVKPYDRYSRQVQNSASTYNVIYLRLSYLVRK